MKTIKSQYKEGKKISKSDPKKAKILFSDTLKKLQELKKEAYNIPKDTFTDTFRDYLVFAILLSPAASIAIQGGRQIKHRTTREINKKEALSAIDKTINEVKKSMSEL